MNDLLLLGRSSDSTDELANLFQNAGYKVVEVKDVIACCRQLRENIPSTETDKAPPPQDLPVAEDHRAITIFNANSSKAGRRAHSREEQLRECIVSLARQLTPGWRLSMRHRHLETPDGAVIELTSLEFTFIKMFTVVEVGEAVSRKLIVQAFGEDYLSYDQNRIDTLVRRLRQKIEVRTGVKLPLNTERVRGFSFGDTLIIDL
ncbi:helix-turn-helix domain-containing protein [Burkholderia sp. LMU1-1-1.1]|jgi:hypothetical protein|uniref:helix-turn-helix domain-containing protein n=1 Tax=Burkholderia sp. LMU1-1-1.1 TaxID=3135266 RepID=UPI00341E3171